jgi:hypothetical protein
VLTNAQIRECSRLSSSDERYEYVRRIKDAKLKGLVREPKPPKEIGSRTERRLRTANEIFELQEAIREYYGNGVATKCLAWAAGEINDNDLRDFLKRDLAKHRIMFSGIPKDTEIPVMGVVEEAVA